MKWILLVLAMAAEIMAIETPKYKVLNDSGKFQIREYTEYVTADVAVDGGFDEAGNKAFRALFDYISGNNSKKQKVDMTAPVEQKSRGEKISMTAPVEQKGKEGSYTLSFVLPQTLTIDNAPTPNDPRIVLRNNPVRRIASITYSGFWSESNYRESLKELQDWMVSENLKPKGEPIYARYNSPFSIWFLRRNEILIELQ
jgi:hypothetical protein